MLPPPLDPLVLIICLLILVIGIFASVAQSISDKTLSDLWSSDNETQELLFFIMHQMLL